MPATRCPWRWSRTERPAAWLSLGRSSPSRLHGLVFRTEPPFALARADPGALVISLEWQVIDALAPGTDIALDDAAGRRCLIAPGSAPGYLVERHPARQACNKTDVSV